ncbi:uncharacterized protein LOC113359738 [Papaver somniferum]|uniref:uncharacterized protein LOC113359738 n=1 Tax=Papaver somniferum TaxID=3469 RepID=UPI000E70312F|nr:uncharacterized protein LOC113359738 [Papaver somniferum]
MGGANLIPIYYLSKTLKDAKLRYIPAEKACLPLILAAQKIRHYLLKHKCYVVAAANPIVYLTTKPIQSGKLACWSMQLLEFDFTPIRPQGVWGQAIADLLAELPGSDTSEIHTDLPGEIASAEETPPQKWKISFDGSSYGSNGGAGIIFESLEGNIKPYAYKLDYPCTNNAAEYESFLIRMQMALEMGIKDLEVTGDSRLLVNKMEGDFRMKEPTLAVYRDKAQRLMRRFDRIAIEHMGRLVNKHAEALATMASKLQMSQGDREVITIIKKTSPMALKERDAMEELDWRRVIIADLKRPPEERQLSWKTLKAYTLLERDLYFITTGDGLCRFLGPNEIKEKLEEIHA